MAARELLAAFALLTLLAGASAVSVLRQEQAVDIAAAARPEDVPALKLEVFTLSQLKVGLAKTLACCMSHA